MRQLRSEIFAILRRHDVSEQCFAEVAMVTHAALVAQGIEAGTGETDFCAESAQKSGSTATPRKPGPKDAP